jgi:hypothetical protein
MRTRAALETIEAAAGADDEAAFELPRPHR